MYYIFVLPSRNRIFKMPTFTAVEVVVFPHPLTHCWALELQTTGIEMHFGGFTLGSLICSQHYLMVLQSFRVHIPTFKALSRYNNNIIDQHY